MTFKENNVPPLVPLCCLLCLGIVSGTILKEGAFVYFYLLIPVAIWLFFKTVKKKPARWSKGFFFFLLGALLIHRIEYPSVPLHHISSHQNQGKVWVVGKVVSLFPEKRKSIVVTVTAAGKSATALLKSTGRLKVTVRDSAFLPAYGDMVRVKGRIRPFRNFANPGGFDYVRFMKRKGIMASLYCRGPDFSLEKNRETYPWTTRFIRGIARVRNDFSLHIQSTVKDQDSAALLNALVLGKRKMLTTDLQNTFSRSGASHVLAVSGLHLSIVAGLFFFLFQKFFSLFTPFLLRGLARKTAALMTLLPLSGYALISGFSPATQRALLMVSVVMFSFAMERENSVLNSLAAAGIAILLARPGALFSISFQLSFVAVFFIIAGLDLARRHGFPSFAQLVFNKIVLFFLVSLLAITGTQPLVMHYFNMASFMGIFTNGVTIPVVGFGVLPLGLLSLLLFPVSDFFCNGCLVMAGAMATPCIAFLSRVCEFPWAWSRTVTPDMVYLGAWYLAMGAIYLMLRGWKKWGMLVGITVFCFVLAKAGLDIRNRFFNPSLKITVLDVGQGNSALVHMPGGRCFLVDGGGFSSNAVFDPGRYLVAPYLWRQHILTLDGVVLTHPEADHMNGLLYIFENFRVKVVYKNKDSRQTKGYQRLMALVRSRNVTIHRVDPRGEMIPMDKGGSLEFFPGFSGKTDGRKKQKNYNDNSLVMRVEFRDFSMLFPGDIMTRREVDVSALPTWAEDLRSTVLLVPHHGSSTSSTPTFLDRVKPQMAIVSCGWRNRFRFPHARVVQRYRKRKIPLLRTDRDGAVCIVSHGTTWHIQTTREKSKFPQIK
ncbi:competence protein ComEC [Desulfocicer vacuolatum DSM 3385]|uniref:Competence protein ComEC n=1 Tax=Desulfocicer vacuolatum DSM 3385 TaxID=1121400 RepID=A0A1W1ZN94_9BACT|nr:DNA internalization-related competence protein ComEC/Rec2 [Desulfocicer vacuolatum]SMC49837.1 competence protein ComEC [Desulfocicer vacuolatum DSM 3385]